MSTLTKVLVILLTISSIFLCGIVTTYVANAQHYKAMYDNRTYTIQQAQSKATNAENNYNKAKDAAALKEKELNNSLADLQQQIEDLETDLQAAERKADQLLGEVSKLASVVTDTQAMHNLDKAKLDNTETEVKDLKAQKVKLDSYNSELTQTLIQKEAIIAQLQDDKKRLESQRAQLQTKFQQYLQQIGKTVTTRPEAAPPKKSPTVSAPAPAVSPKIEDIGLKGTITAIEPKFSVAEISIGRADGVKDNMKFYVTRGSKFVCELLILDVDTEQAVGLMELVETPPKIGDKVSTNKGT